MVQKPWLAVVLALVAAVVFLVGALELPSQSLKDPTFDMLLGLVFVSLGLAVWFAPA